MLEHLGSAHTEAELAALVAVARRKVHPGQGELNLSAGAVPARHAVITSKSSAVLWQVLSGTYTRLGFDAVGDESSYPRDLQVVNFDPYHRDPPQFRDHQEPRE